MNENSPLLPQTDLNEVFYSALALHGITNYFIEAKYVKRATLSASAKIIGKKISARISDGFSCVSRETLLGLALTLVAKLFRKKNDGEKKVFTNAYREFRSRETVSRLADSLRATRTKNFVQPQGNYYDLNAGVEKIFLEYASVFNNVEKPLASWSRKPTRAKLGWHDSAFKKIVLSRALDSPRIPYYVVEYVVFHELLHCKHAVLYQRGMSLRRTIHSKEFKEDEKKFCFYQEAVEWIKNSWR